MEPRELLRMLVEALEGLGIPYALGGSIASMAYGEPRSTRDIDVVADLRETHLEGLAARMPEPDFFLDPVSAGEAVRAGRPFNVLHVKSGMKIDVFPPSDELARRQIERAVRIAVGPDLEPRFSPPEELVVQKMRYYRESGSERHLRDVAAMLAISPDEIDREEIGRLAARFGVDDVWREVLAALDRPRDS